MFFQRTPIRAFLIPFILICLLASPIFAGGGRESDTRIILARPASFISPTGADSSRQKLVIDGIKLQIAKGGTIKRYDFSIYDKAGQLVYSASAAQSNGKGFLGEAFNVGAQPVQLPTAFTWNGTDAQGQALSDGEYFYQLTAIDSWGMPASTAPLSVVIDTVPPRIDSVALTSSVISPDGDGNKDQLQVRAQTGPAFRWTEKVIRPGGAEVWRSEHSFAGESEGSDRPMNPSTTWDPLSGENSAKAGQIPEGNYQYVLTGIDHAGNAASKMLDFQISYAGSMISIIARDGVKELNATGSITVLPKLAEAHLANGWGLEIRDSDNVVWRRWTGSGTIPEQFVIVGRGKPGQPESDTDRLVDGIYTIRAWQDYASGFSAIDQSFSFRMDSTPPQASLVVNTADYPTNTALVPWFGGLRRQALHLQLKAQEDLAWVMELTNLDGKYPGFRLPVLALTQELDKLRYDWEWGGMLPVGCQIVDQAGDNSKRLEVPTLLPDGQWSLRILAQDAAGNVGGTDAVTFVRVGKHDETLVLEQDTQSISPGVSGQQQQVRFELKGMDVKAADLVRVSVSDDGGKEVFRRVFRPELPLAWQGQSTDGLPAPTGTYHALVTVEYRNGDVVELSAKELQLEARGESSAISSVPGGEIQPGISLDVVVPDVINLAGEEGSPIVFQVRNANALGADATWTLKVLDSQYTPIWQTSGNGAPPAEIAWSGMSPDYHFVEGLQRLTARWEIASPSLEGAIQFEKPFLTGIPVVQEGKRWRIMVSDILFAGDNPDPFSGDPQQVSENLTLIRRLGEKLAGMVDHKLIIEGHATYAGPLEKSAMAIEQKQDLLPLAWDRAMEIKRSLFILGVDWAQMELKAQGGADPVVPFDKTDLVWKNRRVVLYLEG